MDKKSIRYLKMGLGILLVLIVLAVIGIFFASDYNSVDLLQKEQPPSSEHLLGTDALGRDVLGRLLFATAVSMWIGLLATATQLILGVSIGVIAAYFGGAIDFFLMRLVDTLMCFPVLILATVLSAVTGPSIINLSILIGLLSWTEISRITRAEVLQFKNNNFILASKLSNFTFFEMTFYHIVPNILPKIAVSATLGMANSIIMEASLSFLGLGVQAPMPSLGNMLSASLDVRSLQDYWWTWFPAGVVIIFLVLSINFIGEGLRYRKG